MQRKRHLIATLILGLVVGFLLARVMLVHSCTVAMENEIYRHTSLDLYHNIRLLSYTKDKSMDRAKESMERAAGADIYVLSEARKRGRLDLHASKALDSGI